jgi:hypothetical protein
LTAPVSRFTVSTVAPAAGFACVTIVYLPCRLYFLNVDPLFKFFPCLPGLFLGFALGVKCKKFTLAIMV